MSPGCTVCGYAVDWLRSCYSSQWRLFADSPDTLTPGFYYFCDPKTPFYPGEHIFGSRNWTTPEIVDPPLGEASGRQRYRKGDLQVPAPPATLVGTAHCVASGDVFDDGRVPLTLVGGVDSRCYPSPPPPPPVFWFRVGSLSRLAAGNKVTFWPDLSYVANDAELKDFQPPTYQSSGPSGPHVDFGERAFLQLQTQGQVTGDLCVFLAARGDWTGSDLDALRCGVLVSGEQAPLVVYRNLFGFDDSGSQVLADAPYDLTGAYRLFWARRRSGLVTFGLGATWASAPQMTANGTCFLEAPFLVSAESDFALAGHVLEGRLYDSALSDSQFNSIRDSLIAAYALVP